MTFVPLGDVVAVRIEVSRFAFIKRRPDGTVHFLSPIPTPFNYGSVPDTLAADGDPGDALVLGRRLPRGAIARGPVRAIANFVDHGLDVPKLVVSARPLSWVDRATVRSFFTIYARAKRVIDPGEGTRYEGMSY